MAELAPQPFEVLLARVDAEFKGSKSVFDLEARHFWKGDPALDLSVRFHGDAAANAAGPAAGPQSQLAQNLALSWLAGARVLELKTVQVNDQLRIPRPCIDVQNVGFNVEWSQELRLAQSLEEYVSGWFLVHVLQKLNLQEAPPSQLATLFDFSVGYDLKGIQSDPVARWLDGLADASALLARLRERVPRHLRHLVDGVEPPARVSSCITLSTFHGCPAGEIERIVEHLYARHGVHVVVKMNPTLLGYEAVEALLRGKLGYEELALDKKYFDADLKWEQALAMFGRLETAAARAGKTLGAKFTNTLVVENYKSFFPKSEEVMYLSGQPLHVVSTTLAAKFAQATGGRYGTSFSAGIDERNFFEAVACGMAPVTACTDLLRPGGYARLPRYLKRLEEEMKKAGASTVDEFVVARAGGGLSPAEAALRNLQAYAARVAGDPRYAAPKNRAVPRRVGTSLALFDCVSCDKCVAVCPQDANFALELGPGRFDAPDLVFRGGALAEARPFTLEVKKERQWANYADFCNECGNCDVFCPEEGGPYKVKPRFFGSRETFERFAQLDGLFVESRARLFARVGGVRYELVDEGGVARFSDGEVGVALDAATGALLSTRTLGDGREHVLPLWRCQALRLLRDAMLAGVNAASARLLAGV